VRELQVDTPHALMAITPRAMAAASPLFFPLEDPVSAAGGVTTVVTTPTAAGLSGVLPTMLLRRVEG
jgi:hypothetical protein